MTEQTLPAEHLSVAMTTEPGDGDAKDTYGLGHSLPLGFDFYFMWVVLVIGVVGVAANALITYALVASKQHKKHPLIFNQNVIDTFTCFWLIITYAMKLADHRATGVAGYLLCMLISSESIYFVGFLASKFNLQMVTIERYLKIVHPVWSKKLLRNWVAYSAIAFSWIGSVIYNFGIAFWTTKFVDGYCLYFSFWPAANSLAIYGIYNFISFFAIPLVIFVFCYGRMLMVIRRQASVMAGHSTTGPNTTQTQSHAKIQTNVIKTMVVVTAFFAICNSPLEFYLLIFGLGVPIFDYVYYISIFLSFVYISINPFIYATKFKPVKEVLRAMIPCKSISVCHITENSHIPTTWLQCKYRNDD